MTAFRKDDNLSRGVYRLPFVGRSGEWFLVIINRFGQKIYEAVVYQEENMSAAELALWEILDREDPPTPHLRLV